MASVNLMRLRVPARGTVVVVMGAGVEARVRVHAVAMAYVNLLKTGVAVRRIVETHLARVRDVATASVNSQNLATETI
jgi:hypothetical protein